MKNRHCVSTIVHVRSVIMEHRLQFDHDFQWDKVKILDEEPCYRKRLISDMLNIKNQKNSLNLQTDTESLHKAYTRSVQKVSRILNFRGLRTFDFRFFCGVMLVLMSLTYADKFGHFECSVNF